MLLFLDNEDYKTMDSLYKIVELIFNDYKKLYNLDTKIKKHNNDDYLNITKEINTLKDIENLLYEYLTIDCFKIRLIINKYLEKYKLASPTNIEANIINDDNLITKRILLKLITTSHLYQKTNNKKKLEQKYLEKDFLKIFLSFLQEKIDTEHNKNLIWYKYKTIFLYQNLENELIDHNFNMEKSTYLDSQLYFDILNISEKEEKKLRNEYACNIVKEEILNLTNNINLYDNKDENVIKNCLLRSGLLLLDNTAHLEMNEFFHNIIDNNEIDFNSVNDISSSFKSCNIDRKRHKYISLKKRTKIF